MAKPKAPDAKTVEIVMPEMGESVAEGTILEWHKHEGDQVEEGETVVEVSTDKVDAEVPAPASGTLTKIRAQADETVKVGQVLAEMTAGQASGDLEKADGTPPGAETARRSPRPRARPRAPMEDGSRPWLAGSQRPAGST